MKTLVYIQDDDELLNSIRANAAKNTVLALAVSKGDIIVTNDFVVAEQALNSFMTESGPYDTAVVCRPRLKRPSRVDPCFVRIIAGLHGEKPLLITLGEGPPAPCVTWRFSEHQVSDLVGRLAYLHLRHMTARANIFGASETHGLA